MYSSLNLYFTQNNDTRHLVAQCHLQHKQYLPVLSRLRVFTTDAILTRALAALCHLQLIQYLPMFSRLYVSITTDAILTRVLVAPCHHPHSRLRMRYQHLKVHEQSVHCDTVEQYPMV